MKTEPAHAQFAALFEAVRVLQLAVAERIPSAIAITEREVLAVGEGVSEVVAAARAQVAASKKILTEVDERSGIVVAIDRLAAAMASFLERLGPVLERQRDISTAAATNSAKIEEAGAKIESIALAANILNLNAQIEAARLGAIGEPFMIIASEMSGLTRQIEEANCLISELSSGLGASLPEIAAMGREMAATCVDFRADFEAQAAAVRDAQGHMQQIVRGALESTEERAESMLRVGQAALSHLQFQDPVAQSLRQVQMGLAAIAGMVGATAGAYEDALIRHAGSSDGHNPIHALALQHGLELVRPVTAEGGDAAPPAPPAPDPETEAALDNGDVLLF